MKNPIALLVLLLTGCIPCLAAELPAKPNIVLIIADDLGQQLGCYGDANARTPNIDRMAAEGVRFENAYVTASSCSPSRGSIMTGLYPHQHGMMGLSHFGTERMHDDVPKLPNALKAAGYRTGLIGKSHFEPMAQFQFDYYNEDLQRVIRDRDVLWMNERAVDFMDGTPAGQPFFLIMSYIDPHRGDSDDSATYGPGKNIKFPRVKKGLPAKPQQPGEVTPFPFLGLDSPEIREEMADFYGSLARLDIGIGDLRKKLEEHNAWDNSMILLVGDNGPDVTRGKMAVYESATRIPMIVKAPGAEAGLVREELVSTIDIFPTFLAAAGAAQPLPDVRQTGAALQRLLRPGKAPWRETLSTEYITHVPWHFYPRFTIRNERYKLIFNLFGGERENPLEPHNYCNAWWEAKKPAYDGTPIRTVYDHVDNPPRIELFDLGKDPFEMNNIADNPEYRELRERLMGSLMAWRNQTADPFLDPAEVAKQDKKGLDYKTEYDRRYKNNGPRHGEDTTTIH